MTCDDVITHLLEDGVADGHEGGEGLSGNSIEEGSLSTADARATVRAVGGNFGGGDLYTSDINVSSSREMWR